ncbi:MAG: aminotransferase class I/II-fold pyridoxal phosphate-dependent enzyme [Balneolaceae bacterium]
MNKQKIWLSSPHMGGEELDYIHQAFEKNWIAPLGDNVNGFEDDLKNYVGTKSAGAFTSGTASIHLALILLGVETGDEVLCQSFTFSASANPITYQGATPVFIDSELDTWNMDPKLLEQAIIERKDKLPKAIIVVHLYGMPANMDKINEIGEKYGIPIIEDAAEALGSHINKKNCGSFGKLNILSFNGNKIITTSGGGALLSDDEELIKKARFLATQARDDAPHYQHSHIGYNYRMSNIVAGIGRGQMKVIDTRVSQRRAVHDRYFESLGKTWLEGEIQNSKPKIFNLSPTGIYFMKEPEGYFSNRWLTTIIVNPDETGGITREDLRLALEKENIEARPLWKPMHAQPVFANAPAYINGVSDWLFEYGLCLPSGSNMSEEDQERVIGVIKETIA